MVLKFKKAISPIVAVSLILVVTVVSVASFSGWFSSFSNDLFLKSETKGTTSEIVISNVILDSNQLKVYAKTENSYSIINNVKINDIECNMIGSNVVDSSLTEVLLDCSGNFGLNEILLVTNSGVYTYKFSI